MVPSSELFVGLKFKKPPLTRSISFTMAFQDHQDFPVLPRGANFSPQREEKLEEVHSCGKITIINGKIHYKWPFSIAMLNYQRVSSMFGVVLVSHPSTTRDDDFSVLKSPSYWPGRLKRGHWFWSWRLAVLTPKTLAPLWTLNDFFLGSDGGGASCTVWRVGQPTDWCS